MFRGPAGSASAPGSTVRWRRNSRARRQARRRRRRARRKTMAAPPPLRPSALSSASPPFSLASAGARAGSRTVRAPYRKSVISLTSLASSGNWIAFSAPTRSIVVALIDSTAAASSAQSLDRLRQLLDFDIAQQPLDRFGGNEFLFGARLLLAERVHPGHDAWLNRAGRHQFGPIGERRRRARFRAAARIGAATGRRRCRPASSTDPSARNGRPPRRADSPRPNGPAKARRGSPSNGQSRRCRD